MIGTLVIKELSFKFFEYINIFKYKELRRYVILDNSSKDISNIHSYLSSSLKNDKKAHKRVPFW